MFIAEVMPVKALKIHKVLKTVRVYGLESCGICNLRGTFWV